ncbi:unnamed protein product [Amoebophrya sp. A120]|nr:unnamed protein product [Amoebophrya sp. A120]|eukprot:GSA120T00020681001.1
MMASVGISASVPPLLPGSEGEKRVRLTCQAILRREQAAHQALFAAPRSAVTTPTAGFARSTGADSILFEGDIFMSQDLQGRHLEGPGSRNLVARLCDCLKRVFGRTTSPGDGSTDRVDDLDFGAGGAYSDDEKLLQDEVEIEEKIRIQIRQQERQGDITPDYTTSARSGADSARWTGNESSVVSCAVQVSFPDLDRELAALLNACHLKRNNIRQSGINTPATSSSLLTQEGQLLRAVLRTAGLRYEILGGGAERGANGGNSKTCTITTEEDVRYALLSLLFAPSRVVYNHLERENENKIKNSTTSRTLQFPNNVLTKTNNLVNNQCQPALQTWYREQLRHCVKNRWDVNKIPPVIYGASELNRLKFFDLKIRNMLETGNVPTIGGNHEFLLYRRKRVATGMRGVGGEGYTKSDQHTPYGFSFVIDLSAGSSSLIPLATRTVTDYYSRVKMMPPESNETRPQSNPLTTFIDVHEASGGSDLLFSATTRTTSEGSFLGRSNVVQKGSDRLHQHGEDPCSEQPSPAPADFSLVKKYQKAVLKEGRAAGLLAGFVGGEEVVLEGAADGEQGQNNKGRGWSIEVDSFEEIATVAAEKMVKDQHENKGTAILGATSAKTSALDVSQPQRSSALKSVPLLLVWERDSMFQDIGVFAEKINRLFDTFPTSVLLCDILLAGGDQSCSKTATASTRINGQKKNFSENLEVGAEHSDVSSWSTGARVDYRSSSAALQEAVDDDALFVQAIGANYCKTEPVLLVSGSVSSGSAGHGVEVADHAEKAVDVKNKNNLSHEISTTAERTYPQQFTSVKEFLEFFPGLRLAKEWTESEFLFDLAAEAERKSEKASTVQTTAGGTGGRKLRSEDSLSGNKGGGLFDDIDLRSSGSSSCATSTAASSSGLFLSDRGNNFYSGKVNNSYRVLLLENKTGTYRKQRRR